jgi:protein-S-isoprenylcysteine O-methyltransferase Ste14
MVLRAGALPALWIRGAFVMLLLKNFLFTVFVPGTVAVSVPLLLARDRVPVAGPVRAPAVLALAAGALVYAWCVWDFATFGRGTPAPIDAPKRLVVRGLYRVTRNPMYVGVLGVILGWTLWFGSALLAAYGLVVWSCFQSFVVFYEEPHLRRVFGGEYEAYCARVGRWLPRLGRRAG